MASTKKAVVFRGVTEEQLAKIRKDYPPATFNVEATKKNGTYDVTITKKK